MQLDKESTILVTGAGGFIGGHLMAELIRSGHQSVRGVDIKPLESGTNCRLKWKQFNLICRLLTLQIRPLVEFATW